jgi:hypothetical protein
VTESPAPRVRVAPRAADTYGDLASDLAGDYGLVPDDWQRLILDDWLAVDHGRWASMKCGLSVPRQNGKNGALEVRELFGMIGRGEKVLHTAHQVKTAQKHFRRLKHFFGKKADDPSAKFPELNALVAELRNVNGQEAIFLKNGGSVEIVARSQGSGRGFTVDVIVCDEAQDMSDDDLEALLSTSSAGPLGDPQWIFTGTPPGPRANGEVFARNRADALDGKSKKVSWLEWAAEAGDDLDDPKVWATANPGLVSGRLLLDVIEGERGTFSDEGFMRERLGMWATAGGSQVIDSESWRDAADEASMATDRLALAVDVSPDRATASVAVAGQRDDGTWHVELDETRHGVGWLPAYIELRCARNDIRAVVIDGASPAASIIDDLRQRKIKVTTTSASDMAAACGTFYDGAMDGWLHHIDQPQLNAALSVARKRAILGDRWAWNRKNAASDITPLVAATLALWGAQSSTVKKPRRSSGSGSSGRVVVL